MKIESFCLVFATLLLKSLAAPPPEIAAIMKKFHEQCSKESKVDDTVLNNAKSGNTDVTNAGLRDHLFCYCLKNGFIDEEGNLLEDVVKPRLLLQIKDNAAIDKTVKLCGPWRAKERKHHVAEVIICLQKNLPEGVQIL